MAQHGQGRGEAGQLALPVADHRGRAHDQVGAVAVPPGEQGDGLQRLAEAHVVGEQRPDAQVGERLEPGHTGALVGAQGGVDADEAGAAVVPGREQAVDEVQEHAVGDDLDRAELAVGPLAGQRRRQGLRSFELAALASRADQVGQRHRLVGVEPHPLALPQDERLLEGDDLGELVGGEAVVADGRLPAERAQRIRVEAGTRDAGAGIAHGRAHPQAGPQLAGALGGQLGRQHHPEAGRGQGAGAVGQERRGIGRREGEAGGAGLGQAGVDRGEQAGGLGQAPDQGLLRVDQPSADGLERARPGLPHLLGGDDQAGLVGRLEQVVEGPRLVGRGRGRRVELDAQPGRLRPGAGERGGPPGDVVGAFGALGRHCHHGVGAVEGRDPPGADVAGGGRAVPVASCVWLRGSGAGVRHGVGERGEEVGRRPDRVVVLVPPQGVRRGRHGGGQRREPPVRRVPRAAARRQPATMASGPAGRRVGTMFPAATCSRASLAATLQARTESLGRCHGGQASGAASPASRRTPGRIGSNTASTSAAATLRRARALAGATVGRRAGVPTGAPSSATAAARSAGPHSATWPSAGTRPPGQNVACTPAPGPVTNA